MILQNSVGIDIGNSRLSLVNLRTSLRGIRITAEETHPLEKTKTFKDKLDMVVYLIREFIRNHNLASADIFIGIPDEHAMMRELRFPMAVKENLRDTLTYEMEKFIPIPAGELYFDTHIPEEDKQNNILRILMAVAKKTVIAPYLELAERLETAVSGIETRSSAIANCFAYHIKPEDSKQSYDWLHRLHKGQAVELSEDIEISQQLIPAFGLALKGLVKVVFDFNFLPREQRKKRGKTAYYTMLVLLCLAMLSGIGWGASRAVHYRMNQKNLNTQIQQLAKEVGEVDRIRSEIEILEKKVQYMNQLRNIRPSVSDMLAEMSRKLPDTAWVQQFTLSEKSMQIEGSADSASELLQLLEASPVFREVAFLSGITKERDGKERFMIGLKPE